MLLTKSKKKKKENPQKLKTDALRLEKLIIFKMLSTFQPCPIDTTIPPRHATTL